MDKKDSIYNVRPTGDWHLGAPGCDEELLLKTVKWIDDSPYHYTIGMGDYTETNTSDNERSLGTFDREMLARLGLMGLWEQQQRSARLVLKPLVEKGKVIGLHIGNHDDRVLSHDGFKKDYIEWLETVTGKKVNYLGNKAYILLNFVYKGSLQYQYKLITMHGDDFNGKTPATVENKAYNAYAGYEDFDAIVFGHTHFTFANKHYRNYLDVSGEAPVLRTKKFYIVNSGTFLRGEIDGFDSYSDKKFGGAIREPGTATLTFEPYKAAMYAHI